MSSLADAAAAEVMREFSENGCVIRRHILSAAEIATLQTAAGNLARVAECNPRDAFYNYYLPHRTNKGVLYDVYHRDPDFRRVAESPNLISFIRRVLGKEFYLFENSVVYKPRVKENAVPWHQDFMYTKGDPEKAIVWIALDKIDESNGCLHVLPGTHKSGALPRLEVKGETHAKRTNRRYADERKAVLVIMEPGDALICNQYLLHSFKRVDVDAKRRAFRVAVKRQENSYVPRATPTVLSHKPEGSALLTPYWQMTAKHPFLAYCERKMSSLGTRIQEFSK